MSADDTREALDAIGNFRECLTDPYDFDREMARLRAHVAAVVAEKDAEIERLHSWSGVMSLLDEHYPADVWPARDDDADTMDPGHRILSLMRHLDSERARADGLVAAVKALADE
jgi:mannose/cellobiose epimerase-like protein (N-acyl-D-glucosamine 2-epimerase family)